MINQLLSTVYDYTLKNVFNKQQQSMYERVFDKQRRYMKQREGAATSLFNRMYYRNYLDTPNARNMLSRLREQLSEQTRALRNAGVVTGATCEALAAQQRNNNKMIEDTLGALANADMAQKERVMESYEAERRRLDDYLHQADMESYMKILGLEQERIADNLKFWQPLVSTLYNNVKNAKNENV